MTDVFSREKRSWVMGRVRSVDTAPEKTVRSFLHRLGYRFRLHDSRLPGKPDIVLPRYKTAIFVNGCFWHGHTCSEGRRPQSNTTYWNAKIDRNKQRDKQHSKDLKEIGWRPIVVWGCEVDSPDRLKNRLTKLLEPLRRCD